jgi:ubiquitin C-terminal hydrolase
MEVKKGLLQTLLGDFQATEFLNAEDDYVCQRCAGLVQKTLHVQPLGRALLLHLKRFEITGTGRNRCARKRNDVVSFPRTLAFGTARYEFTALVEHICKTTHSGHYVAFVQSTMLLCCNDDDVVEVPWQEVEKRQAYLLAYVRTDT